MARRLAGVMGIFALVVGLVLATACGTNDDCIPYKGISERGAELYKRIKDSYDKLKSDGAPKDEVMGKFDCNYTVKSPGTKPFPMYMGGIRFTLEELGACLDALGPATTSTPKLFNCLMTIFHGRITSGLRDALILKGNDPMIASLVTIDNLKCAPIELKLQPDPRFLQRAPGPELLIPVMIQLLEEGTTLVPSPASFPIFLPGVHQGSGEEACLDVPEPAKRCTDTSGCPEPDGGRPPGAEDPGASGGEIIPPGVTTGAGTSGDYP